MALVTPMKSAPATPSRASRMTPASIERGRRPSPVRLVLHGPDGCGKTTFGADAPGAIFLPSEDGSGFLDVARFPAPKDWQDHLDAIDTLLADPGDFRTLVWDSLDHSETMLHDALCKEHGVKIVEDIGGGYGKWVNVVVDSWRVALARLERLQRERGMNVVLIAHSQIKNFANPEGPDFNRYQIKLADKSAAVIREWSHSVGFAQYEQFGEKDTRTKKVKGVSTGARIVHFQRSAAFDAKDRTGLPESLPLSWEAFAEASRAGVTNLTNLVAEIKRKAAQLGGDFEKKATDFIATNGSEPTALAKLNDRLNALLAEKAQREEA